MARIRSIKPEFWRDEKIATLKNKLSALFFIGLWNVADDEGKFPWNPKQLSLELPIFRTKEVTIYLEELFSSGLVKRGILLPPDFDLTSTPLPPDFDLTMEILGVSRESAWSQWGLISGWKHQRIDKPKVPEVKNESIQWFIKTNSTKGRESSKNIPRKDRIGKDRIGKDRTTVGNEGSQATPIVAVDKSLGSLIWESYSQAFEKRYGVAPKRNATTNTQCTNLGKRLGEDAIKVVEFYLKHNDGFFLKQQHPIGLCLSNAEGLYTQYLRNQPVTGAQVRVAEKTITNADSLNSYFKQLENEK